jgi:class 3 adenylate cyclase
MSLSDDLKLEVDAIFEKKWELRDGLVVPDDKSIRLNNDGVKIDATVLYADLADSTDMVNTKKKTFSAEVFKSFLWCAGKIINDSTGNITSFDGDRIMAVFVGNSKNTNAVKAALKINWSVKNIVNPAMRKVYDTDFVVRHGVGIDMSELLVAKTGIRGSNDLVWVGPAANYAAKLCQLREGNYSTWISKNVFNNLNASAKYSNEQLMWEKRIWKPGQETVYRSSYWWRV